VKLLLDECIDKQLARELPGYFVRTVPQEGWAGLKNGRLLSLAQKKFDVFITVDRNLSVQQDLSKYNIAILVLSAPTNRFDDLKKLIPKILAKLPKLRKHQSFIIFN
jgi:hypothetical protein